jgi:hypothetical protein
VRLSITVKFISILCLVLLLSSTALADLDKGPGLPDRIGDFSAQGYKKPSLKEISLPLENYLAVPLYEREYAAPGGGRLAVLVFGTPSPSAAYSILRTYPREPQLASAQIRYVPGVGFAGSAGPELGFAKGHLFVAIRELSENVTDEAVLTFAVAVASSIEGNVGWIPELVLHLPEWDKKHQESGENGVGYAVTNGALKALFNGAGRDASVLEAISFDGGAEAVTAQYGDARLLIVEFTTPQYAVENDARIAERIAQLRAEGQPAPSAYRRVGNYSVMVFSNDPASAEQLLSSVKYEKDVRWLGRNPHEDEIAQRAYTNTMTGVIVTVLKTTGLAIVLCLGVGALFGGMVFLRRRARAAAGEAYSDAGGMVRLDLVEDATVSASTAGISRRKK